MTHSSSSSITPVTPLAPVQRTAKRRRLSDTTPVIVLESDDDVLPSSFPDVIVISDDDDNENHDHNDDHHDHNDIHNPNNSISVQTNHPRLDVVDDVPVPSPLPNSHTVASVGNTRGPTFIPTRQANASTPGSTVPRHSRTHHTTHTNPTTYTESSVGALGSGSGSGSSSLSRSDTSEQYVQRLLILRATLLLSRRRNSSLPLALLSTALIADQQQQQQRYSASGGDNMSYEEMVALHDAANRGRDRARAADIDALPVRKAEEADREYTCCVCMENFQKGETVKTMPCSHVYHAHCIDKWLAVKNCCPVDKKRIGGSS